MSTTFLQQILCDKLLFVVSSAEESNFSGGFKLKICNNLSIGFVVNFSKKKRKKKKNLLWKCYENAVDVVLLLKKKVNRKQEIVA